MKKMIFFDVAIVMLFILPTMGLAGDKAGEDINWQVISSGATDGSSTNYVLLGTVGQTAVGTGSSASYGLGHGYWQDFGGAGLCDCTPGEVNQSPPVNLLDILYIIQYKYKSGSAPQPYDTCSGDANCNCIVDLLDILYIIQFKYKSGPAPCSCEDWVTACGWPLRK